MKGLKKTLLQLRKHRFSCIVFVSAVLLHILQNLVKPSEQTLVFTATKHHVEYLKEVHRTKEITQIQFEEKGHIRILGIGLELAWNGG